MDKGTIMSNILEEKIRQKKISLEQEIIKKRAELKEQDELLIEVLKNKYELSIGDVVGSKKSTDKLFVIKSFLLDFNDYIEFPREELSSKLYSLTKSNKIDKKKQSNCIKMFASNFKVYGKYDFIKDEIIFNES